MSLSVIRYSPEEKQILILLCRVCFYSFYLDETPSEISGKVPMAFKQCEREKNELMKMYLCVLLVAPVNFSQTFSSCFAGRRHCKSLLHFAGTITETSLDTIGFVKFIHLVGTRKVY